jgi:hypothetical protein
MGWMTEVKFPAVAMEGIFLFSTASKRVLEPANPHSYTVGTGGSYKVKVKVKLSLCLTKHHTMKMYWGVEV